VVIDDAALMGKALAIAERGRPTTSPNPMVGALLVDADGVIVGRGAHLRAGGPHAEIFALAEAGPRAAGATLYCTLEPCCHTGRTGPCAPRVVEAGVRRAVVAMRDPNPAVAGRGLAVLRSAGIEILVGVREREAERLNGPFLTWIGRGRPEVTLKAALSRDGYVAAAPGVRTPLTSGVANRRVHRDRAGVDALGIGSGTVLADDPLLTPRGAYRPRPLVRVVFDRRLRTPPAARLLSTLAAGPVIIMTSPEAVRRPDRAAALAAAGATVLDVDAAPAEWLTACLAELARREVTSLTVEGGPALQQAFWDGGLVERVQIYETPHVLGPGGVPWIQVSGGIRSRLEEVTVTGLGPDVRVEGHVHRAG
jgi:diaminohydroxyphosphoribosylaminopyrimidine deaminase/5-amino-6-(5-phosphoribosylamino)uracil reductase